VFFVALDNPTAPKLAVWLMNSLLFIFLLQAVDRITGFNRIILTNPVNPVKGECGRPNSWRY
jgi:hypothetical protein